MLSLIVFVLAFSDFANGLSTVVFGPESRELLLLTSKIAAREGIETSYISASGSETLSRRLMYGPDYSEEGKDEPGKAKPVSSGEDIQECLEKANSICLICHDNAIEEKTVNTLIDSAGEDLSKVVLLSKMGASTAKGGFFGGGDSKLSEGENAIRELCKSKNLDLSIVRAGILKGGGPGRDGNGFGLDSCYYNTLIDIVEASVTMAHDKFTLGADVTQGDTIALPNMFAQMGLKSSFEASPYDTNRIVVSGAVVAAIRHENPVEFSVSAERAEEAPSMEAWTEILGNL
jgi:hypothetical protein